jgi:hypothetical protein
MGVEGDDGSLQVHAVVRQGGHLQKEPFYNTHLMGLSHELFGLGLTKNLYSCTKFLKSFFGLRD